jgi:hypothetical protein
MTPLIISLPPLYSTLNQYYGNPRGKKGLASPSWEADNLEIVAPKWQLFYNGKPTKGVRVHKKCAASLKLIFDEIYNIFGGDIAAIKKAGMHITGGGYCFRTKRGNPSQLSTHSWGCAVDFDPARNGFGDTTPAMDMHVVHIFEKHGWVWGGRWAKPDGMHFQFAIGG